MRDSRPSPQRFRSPVTCRSPDHPGGVHFMSTAVTALARVSLFLGAGFAGSVLAQSDTQSNLGAQCVKTRCFTPSCYKQYAGGYYMNCPDGHHPLPASEQTVQTEADRTEEAELKQS